MKGIDTNILVRYFVNDDTAQTRLAQMYIDTLCEREHNVFISAVVLCELVWVLRRVYGYDKRTIADALEKILNTEQFVFDYYDAFLSAIESYQSINIDFADLLIANINRFHGCESTVTFDKDATKLPVFTLLS